MKELGKTAWLGEGNIGTMVRETTCSSGRPEIFVHVKGKFCLGMVESECEV